VTLNTVRATSFTTLAIGNWINGDGFNPNGIGFNRPSGAAGPDLAVNGPEDFSFEFVNAVTRVGFAVSTGLSLPSLTSEIDHTGAIFQLSTDTGDTGMLTLVDTGDGYSAWVDISSGLPFHVLTFFEPSANVQDQYFGDVFAPATIPEPSSLVVLSFAIMLLGVVGLVSRIPGKGAAADRPIVTDAGRRAPLLRRLLQRAHCGAHLHLIGVASGDLCVGEEIAAAHLGVDVRLVDTGRHGAVLGKGAGGAQ
jgi:hypothetical protein